MMNNIKEM